MACCANRPLLASSSHTYPQLSTGYPESLRRPRTTHTHTTTPDLFHYPYVFPPSLVAKTSFIFNLACSIFFPFCHMLRLTLCIPNPFKPRLTVLSCSFTVIFADCSTTSLRKIPGELGAKAALSIRFTYAQIVTQQSESVWKLFTFQMIWTDIVSKSEHRTIYVSSQMSSGRRHVLLHLFVGSHQAG